MATNSTTTVFTGVESAEGSGCGPGYRRYLVALRDAGPDERGEAPQAPEPSPIYFANSAPMSPTDAPGIRRLAELLWRDELGVSEMWWFANSVEQRHPDVAIPSGVQTRMADVTSLSPGPLLLARLRCVSDVESLLAQFGRGVMACSWLAYGHIADETFGSVVIDPPASLSLGEEALTPEDLPAAFPGAELASAWRYSVLQDLFRYDTGDPFFTAPAPVTDAFEEALRTSAWRERRIYLQLPFGAERLASFIKDGAVIVSA
ncbi:MAG TPA: hypothetical protein VGM37_02120 [Armatimonadota bacterium]|jgi:hypothetical protein